MSVANQSQMIALTIINIQNLTNSIDADDPDAFCNTTVEKIQRFLIETHDIFIANHNNFVLKGYLEQLRDKIETAFTIVSKAQQIIGKIDELRWSMATLPPEILIEIMQNLSPLAQHKFIVSSETWGLRNEAAIPHINRGAININDLHLSKEQVFEFTNKKGYKLEYIDTCFLNMEISDLMEMIALCPNIKKLRWCESSFSADVITELLKLKKLEELTINRYMSEQLPSELSLLTNLKSLHICDCPTLVTIPKEIAQIQLLENLSIQDCEKVDVISPEIAGMPNLKSIMLQGCKHFKFITHLPPEFQAIPNIVSIITRTFSA